MTRRELVGEYPFFYELLSPSVWNAFYISSAALCLPEALLHADYKWGSQNQ